MFSQINCGFNENAHCDIVAYQPSLMHNEREEISYDNNVQLQLDNHQKRKGIKRREKISLANTSRCCA